jgi:hypothetical protein
LTAKSGVAGDCKRDQDAASKRMTTTRQPEQPARFCESAAVREHHHDEVPTARVSYTPSLGSWRKNGRPGGERDAVIDQDRAAGSRAYRRLPAAADGCNSAVLEISTGMIRRSAGERDAAFAQIRRRPMTPASRRSLRRSNHLTGGAGATLAIRKNHPILIRPLAIPAEAVAAGACNTDNDLTTTDRIGVDHG